HDVPIGDRPVEYVEHGHGADIGVGAWAELQLVGMGSKPDIDRQHPQLLQHLQDAAFRRNRQREDHQIDARAAAEFDQIVDRAELALSGAFGAAAIVAAVVEQADDFDAGILLPPQILDHSTAEIAAADDYRAPREAAFARPAAHRVEQQISREDEDRKAADIEGAEPEPREHFPGFGEKRRADGQQEHQRPG